MHRNVHVPNKPARGHSHSNRPSSVPPVERSGDGWSIEAAGGMAQTRTAPTAFPLRMLIALHSDSDRAYVGLGANQGCGRSAVCSSLITKLWHPVPTPAYSPM
jgi:hypothetical protein